MLSKDEIKDYDLLSQALLKRFLLTAEHFRLSFRTKKIESGETYSQFMSRLSAHLPHILIYARLFYESNFYNRQVLSLLFSLRNESSIPCRHSLMLLTFSRKRKRRT